MEILIRSSILMPKFWKLLFSSMIAPSVIDLNRKVARIENMK